MITINIEKEYEGKDKIPNLIPENIRQRMNDFRLYASVLRNKPDFDSSFDLISNSSDEVV